MIDTIDFEGLSDGRSVRNVLSHVAPRKLILVAGSPEATAALRSHAVNEIDGLGEV